MVTAIQLKYPHLPLSGVADEIARSLAYAQEHGGQQQIVTPLLYPGGACVVLRLEESADGYFVSDYGAARREADLIGGSRLFARIARDQAQRHGVNFDSDLIFDLEVPRDALVTAAIAVANASKTAVYETAEALSEKKAADQREQLWRLLGRAFPGQKVEENAPFGGRSETWTFDAIVMMDRPALFQTVAPNSISVHAAVSRFLDIRDNGADETIRVSVPTKMRQTPHLSLLARTSQIVGIDEPTSRFSAFAAAA